MIFERRAYTMEPGHVPAFDKAQTDRGFGLVKSYMDCLVGYFSTRTGVTDQVVHFYRYDSFDDWNTRLRGLYAVPELTPYFVNTRKIVRRQVNGFSELLPVEALNPMWAGGNDWLPETGAKLGALDGDKVIEERAFQLRPGGIPAFVEACNAHGIKALETMDGRTIGAFMSMTGPLHNITLWWWFENTAEREARVATLDALADWQAFIAAITPLLVDQSSLLMTPRPIPEMSPLFA
ncbi:MAG: NIPSNAP family protein [Alphaproteobacteria bacterium]|nr:NIPSNAP family protein [Alphaproteobacteria bacterium]